MTPTCYTGTGTHRQLRITSGYVYLIGLAALPQLHHLSPSLPEVDVSIAQLQLGPLGLSQGSCDGLECLFCNRQCALADGRGHGGC
jgi:hypothetical protein